MKPLYNKILIVTAFAIAMGFLESAVVIYLREIFYPGGFDFPLAPIPPDMALTEILREMATVIMLVTVSMMAGRSFSQRLAWFIFSFAIWDIFYYLFLWILIGWPQSFMTWDILFLIPATWTGPVITPLIITLVMIGFSIVILFYSEKNAAAKINIREWIGLIAGSVILIAAFITDYMKHMLSEFSFWEALRISNQEIMEHAQLYVPESFPWVTYIIGLLVICSSILGYYFRMRKLYVARS